MAYEPKLLILDIETSPNLAHVWGFYEQNVIEVERHWVILSYSYKWYGKDKIHTVCLPDFPGYKKDKLNDEKIVTSLHKLLDECDILVGHNIKAFDLKKIHSRYAIHRLGPNKPFKIIDTLLILRSNFAFSSNKLDDISRQMGYGGKVSHHGKNTWLGCMIGDMKEWANMRRYNPRDVQLTEWLYERVRGFAKPSQHPNLNIYTDGASCPYCQGRLIKKGMERLAGGALFQQYKCVDCGKYPRSRAEKGTPVTIRP